MNAVVNSALTPRRDPVPDAPSNEIYGPFVNTPVWPWFAAGCVIGALFALLFLFAWSYS